MDPQTDQGVEPEIAAPVETGTSLAIETPAPDESDSDRNWKAMRESQEQLRQEVEREKFKRQLLEEEFAKRHKAAQQEQEEDLPDLAPDDWLTVAQHEQRTRKQTLSIVETALAKDRAQRAAEDLPNRIKAKYQDFDTVVSEENVNKLKAQDPEIAAALGQISDPYAQAVAAYKYLKTLVPTIDPAVEASKQRIAANAQKPGSAGAAPSPLSQAGAYDRGPTASEKQRLYQEMVSAARGR